MAGEAVVVRGFTQVLRHDDHDHDHDHDRDHSSPPGVVNDTSRALVVGEVGQFFLAREARGTGAAAALMAAAERALVHRFGASVAFLHCVRGNARARAFYERCGFRLPLRIRRRDDGVDDNGDQDSDDDASGGRRRPIPCYDERGESVVLDLADGRSARIDGLLRFTKPLDSDVSSSSSSSSCDLSSPDYRRQGVIMTATQLLQQQQQQEQKEELSRSPCSSNATMTTPSASNFVDLTLDDSSSD